MRWSALDSRPCVTRSGVRVATNDADRNVDDAVYDEDKMVQLVTAFCERLAEVLPKNQFDVNIEHRHLIRIRGKGARLGDTVWLSPISLCRSPLQAEEWLQLFLDAAARRVQKFVGRRHKPWPSTTAKPKVSIDKDRILVWWGGISEEDAVVALRPMQRKEIGV